MELVFFQPEIPPNTGSIARLCAATETPLNLIEPLGFSLDDKYLKRAGLDYWPHVRLRVWPSWPDFLANRPQGRLVMTSARRGIPYHTVSFEHDDLIVLGPESRGIPGDLLDSAQCLVRIPIWGQVRSLNVSNAASVLLYEAFRQTGALEEK